jgi:hypothetical protein
MMKVFRPFWSYDLKKIEAWLSAMAEKGYYFVELNRWTRCFYFRQAEPKPITYRIVYDKMQGESLSSSLSDEGWTKVLQSGNWYVMSIEKPLEQIKTFAVREGTIKRNRMIMYIFSGILIYLTGIAMFNLTLMDITVFQEGSVNVVESPLWIITYIFLGIAIALFVLAIYSIIKIYKTNKYLIIEKPNKIQSQNHIEERLSKEKEKHLKLAGQMVVKRKFGWMYAPDKLEKWLETMEELGFNLHRVSKTGTVFYFMKGSPRKVSYCADYQNIADESYFDIHRDAGWKSAFISYSSLQKWTIWSQEFSEGEERPQIYSDKSHHLNQARRVAIAYTILFLPVVIMYLFLMGSDAGQLINNNSSNLSLLNTVMFVFCILIFGSFTVRTWLYYLRLKKRYEFSL